MKHDFYHFIFFFVHMQYIVEAHVIMNVTFGLKIKVNFIMKHTCNVMIIRSIHKLVYYKEC